MQNLNFEELKEFLDEKVELFNQPNFIENDPISIPHQFSRKEDVEISGFLTSTIAWGRRDLIMRSAQKMMTLFDNEPFDFVMNHSAADLGSLEKFVHRTFNAHDLKYFIAALKRIYQDHGGIEKVFQDGFNEFEDLDYKNAIAHFNDVFFENCEKGFRTRKHVANPLKGSAAKRVVMYLRWMVRNDDRNVDFGIWNSLPMSHLSCPLDVHTGNVGRLLGFISRKQNDWQTVIELDSAFRKMDPIDPSKYDFALFGLGVTDGWK